MSINIIIVFVVTTLIAFIIGYQIGKFRESLWWGILVEKIAIEYEHKYCACIFNLIKDKTVNKIKEKEEEKEING